MTIEKASEYKNEIISLIGELSEASEWLLADSDEASARIYVIANKLSLMSKHLDEEDE